MQLFSVESIVFSKKIRKKFFAPENLKKPPSKVAHNQPPTFFFQYVLARLPKRPKNRNPVFSEMLIHFSFSQTHEPFIFLSLKIRTLVTEI